MYLKTLLTALTLGAASKVHAQNVSVPIPAQAPPDAHTLAPTLLSFSIEQDRWPDWTGVDARNPFTHSALATYASLTGRPPKMRVGADSEDRTVWSPTVTVRRASTVREVNPSEY